MIKFKKITAVDNAVGEQLKSQAAEDGLEKGGRGTKATFQQRTGYRRRPENIFASMIKDEWESRGEINKRLPVKYIIKKKSPRKRKRGTRSIQSIIKRMCRNKEKPITIG